MPKLYAYNTSATQIKKRYAMIGNTATEIKKRYAMIDNTATLVFQSGEYDQLEYIQTTGTQYIDTDIAVFNQTNLEIHYIAALTAVNYNYNNLWSNCSGEEIPQGWVYSTAMVAYKWGDITPKTPEGTANTSKHTYKFVKKDTTISNVVDSTTHKTETASASYNYKLRLFASKNLSSYGKAKVYGVKIYVGGTLKYDLVPAKRKSDGVLGLRDVVNKKFYTNNGSGTFGAGSVVGTIE